jgi:hypothetical protein
VPSIIKVDQIQSDTGTVNQTSNLSFTGTGRRITGDFSNSTFANRVAFQTSTTNGATNLTVIPNGTNTTTAINLEGDPAATNGSLAQLVNAGGTEVRLNSGIRGTGTYLPLTMYAGGSERMRITTAGVVELTSGQLKFPASQNASSDANTLDDYEEGTWSPRITDDTTSSAAGLGHYRKIGNLVIAQFQHYSTDISSIPAGNALYMSGLPYVQSSVGGSHQVLATPSGTLYGTLLAHDRNGAASFVLYAPSSTDRVNWVTLTRTVWGASSVSVYGTYIYRAAN